MTNRIKCATPTCDRTILQATAARTNGFCMPCVYEHARARGAATFAEIHAATKGLRPKDAKPVQFSTKWEMKPSLFNRLAREIFGSFLAPFGFSSAKSKGHTFYREPAPDVFHIISLWQRSQGTYYDVLVFPHTPSLDPDFTVKFPDRLSPPTHKYAYLTERGIGHGHQSFNSKTEENFRHRFELTIKPLLLNVAIPYLDTFKSTRQVVDSSISIPGPPTRLNPPQ